MTLYDQARYDAIRKAVEELLPAAQKEFEDAVMTGAWLTQSINNEIHFTKISADGLYTFPGEPGYGVQPIRMVSREEFMKEGYEE